MNTIGIRANASYVHYTIVDNKGECFEILTHSKLIVPKALDIPDRLSFIRNCLYSIILEYKVSFAGIRIAENKADVDKERIYIEGVIQELISNSIIEKYFIGNKSKLASLLSVNITDITSYIENQLVFGEIEEWNTYSKGTRESIITSVAAGYL